MARIQHSIKIAVPASILYQQLNRFEDYPRFLDNVEGVQKIDETHLRWTTKMSNRPVEWDAEITRQEEDHCIAWRSLDGSTNNCMIEVQSVGADSSRAVFSLDSEPGQFPGLFAGDRAEQIEHHLNEALEKLKDFVETQGKDTQGNRRTNIPISTASSSGSPTEMLEDEPRNEAGPGGYRND